MKRFVLSLVAAFTLLGLSSCVYSYQSNSSARLETREEMKTWPIEGIENIRSIDVRQGIEVKYAQGGERKIMVSTNIKDNQKLEIKFDGDDEMSIGYSGNVSVNTDKVKTIITISGYDVSEFEATSSATIEVAPNYSNNGKLSLDVSSAGTIKMSVVQASRIEAEASSSGDIILTQVNVDDFEIDASSGADIVVNNLVAKYVSAEASSGADIKLGGKATRVDFDASSGADIKAENLQAEEGSAEATSGADVRCQVLRLTQKSSSGGDVVNVVKKNATPQS